MLDVDLLVRRFRGCVTVEEVKFALTESIAGYGLTQFVYLRWSNETLSVEESLHTYSSAWTDTYVSKGYDLVDPVIGMAHAANSPFTWNADDLATTPDRKRFFDEADGYGLHMGVTVPLKTTAQKRIFITFATSSRSHKFREIHREAGFLSTAKFLALAFHASIVRVRGDISAVLTTRELEVMRLFGLGLNASEVGAILSLKADTVNKTSDRACRKLGQENRAAACRLIGVMGG